ncbi:MAG: MATE family efflux transporter [Chitinophagaceae bacterium]|nr:MATE family efflux transporter [Chitinophagaceae bacterium]
MAAAVSSIPNLKVEFSNRQILNIALPITVSMLIPQLNMLTNSVFLGHLSTEALGNAGITAVFYLVFAVAGNGLTNALQSVFSRYAGQDMSDFFKTIFSQGLRLALIFAVLAILFTWLIAPYIMQNIADERAYPIEMDFLRIRILGLPFLYVFQLCNAFMVASLNSRYLLIGFGIEAIINIVLDYVLIFGKAGFPAMGFNGAAWASVISEIVAMATAILVLYFTRLKQTYNLFHNLKFDALINKEVLKVSAPLVLQYFISLTTWLVFFLLIEKHGEMAKAISNTMRNIFGITGMFVWSFAATSNNMVSNLIGQNKQNLVLPAVVRIMCWSLGVCIVISVLLNIFPYTFFSLFGQAPGL